jgi:hypothetical protein
LGRPGTTQKIFALAIVLPRLVDTFSFPSESGTFSSMLTARGGLGFIAIVTIWAPAFAGDDILRAPSAYDGWALRSLSKPDVPPTVSPAPGVDVTGQTASEPIVTWMPVPAGDVWLHGLEIPSPGEIAPAPAAPTVAQPYDPWSVAPNSRYEQARGPLKLGVETKAKAVNAPGPGLAPPDPWSVLTPGDTGEVKGRLDYETNHWELYGGAGFGLTTGAGPPSMSEKVEVGTYFKLPPALYGGKIGGGVEVNNLTERKARVEYRQLFGDTEGYLKAEHTVPPVGVAPGALPAPTTLPSTAIRAGLNRKF